MCLLVSPNWHTATGPRDGVTAPRSTCCILQDGSCLYRRSATRGGRTVDMRRRAVGETWRSSADANDHSATPLAQRHCANPPRQVLSAGLAANAHEAVTVHADPGLRERKRTM